MKVNSSSQEGSACPESSKQSLQNLNQNGFSQKSPDQVFAISFLSIHASIQLTFLKPYYVSVTILSTVHVALKKVPVFVPSNRGRQTSKTNLEFSRGPVGKSLLASAGDMGSVLDPEDPACCGASD